MQFQATSIWTAIGTSVGITLLITIAFSFLRPHHSIVYAPKLKYADQKHAPPTIGKGLFAWTTPILKLNELDLVDKIGLDATVFLRFTKMCRNMFAVIMIVSIGIVMPTNLITNGKSKWASIQGDGSKHFWMATTPQYTGITGLWVHVVCVWLVNGIVAFFLWRNYMGVTRLRRRFFESSEYLMGLHSRTLIFLDIPPASRTDEGILRLADEVEQTTGLPRAAIARNVKELPELIEAHEKAVRELESVLAKYLKNPDRLPAARPTIRPSRNHRKNNGSEKVDAIDYLTDRISALEMEVKHVRESIDKRNPMPYGFASFEKIEDAHLVAFAARGKHPQGATIKLAPRPNDLIWQNLPLSKRDRSWKRFINNFWIVILTLIWIAPNALIAIFLSNLANLANLWPGFKKNFEGHHTEWSIVQGVASPAITSLIYLILPIIFRRLSMHGGDITKTEREQHVTSKLYAFFVFNNLIIFSVFAAIFQFVTAVIDNSKTDSAWNAIKKGQFFGRILTGLITVSPFWISWLVQRNLGSAADISQILNLIWTWFARHFMSPTPRQWIEWSAPPTMDYAVYYNYFLFYATVALCFVTVQPLIVPITVFFFIVDYYLKKYLLLYVLVTKNESGGQFWRLLFNRFIFATILADAVIALTLPNLGTWRHCAALAPLPFLLLGLKYYCSRTFDHQMLFYIKSSSHDPEHMSADGKKTRRNDRVASKFGHPALYKKLMTPMVHAKAQSAMKDVYRGRMHEDLNAFSPDYSEIAMDSMSQQYPGKTARFAENRGTTKKKPDEMFEVVPESQLDYSFFKDRSDFREEFGNINGPASDLVSERSGTPVSFMHSHTGSGSPSSSRASSPGPGYRSYSPHPAGGPSSNSPYRAGSPRAHLYQQNSYNGDMAIGPSSSSRGRHMYTSSNESGSNLLAGAQAPGFAPPEESEMVGHYMPPQHDPESSSREIYGIDRWRTGGSGYVGVPGVEADEGDLSTGYDSYRGRR